MPASVTHHQFKVEYMQPFVDSLESLFEENLGYEITVGRPHLDEDARASHDISGVITFTGSVIGRAVISFPSNVAEKLAIDFLKIDPLPDGVIPNTVGELAKLIVGRAKSELNDHSITISPPTVIHGNDFTISMQRGAACLEIPCSCKHGELSLHISIVDNPDPGQSDSNPESV